ncbi:MAG: hypothetical protein GOP50_01140, partial [Candidatus Heimdallarchaeota archaeon]|nr:hypothetical protein [Candidatus Heimdallarchaeota archaeon]
YEDETITTTEITGTTYDQTYSVNYTYSMDADSYIIELYIYFYTLVLSSIYENLEVLEATIKTSVNINTGLLEEAKSFVNWEDKTVDNGTTTNHVLGHSNFWMMEETYMATAPELAYLGTFLVGIFVCAVIISLLINKKRKKN